MEKMVGWAYLEEVDSWVYTLVGSLPQPPSSIDPFSVSFTTAKQLCHMLLPPLWLKYTGPSSHDKSP